MNRRLYALHRWVSAIAFLQLALWTLTGAFFAIAPIKRVRGSSVPRAHELPIPVDAAVLPPVEALRHVEQHGLHGVSSLELRATPAGLFYIAKSRAGALRVDARTGSRARVDRSEAEETARRDQPSRPPVVGATLIEKDAGIEYRGKPVPAWRVSLADGSGTAVYVDAITGDVTARRNDLWRWYDFFWSLHIMDYREREGFNHPLIIAAAALAVTTVATGASLWALRLARRLGRRRDPPADTRSGGTRSPRSPVRIDAVEDRDHDILG
jgi:uncharacterized iron-regulated membrane protein